MSDASPFDVGGVIRASGKLIQDHFTLIAILTLILMVVPKLMIVGAHLVLHGTSTEEDPLYDMLNWANDFWDFIGYSIWTGVIGWALTRRYSGQAVSWAGFFEIMLPLVIMTLLSTLGVGLGLLLLIIPGLMLATAWAVAAPALIMEGKSPFVALGRSRDLVRGYSWPVFGLFVLTIVVMVLWESMVGVIGYSLEDAFPEQHMDWIFESIVSPWGSLPMIAIPVTLYFYIVALKEGGTDVSIAEVFD
jgi:hypothetical protein